MPFHLSQMDEVSAFHTELGEHLLIGPLHITPDPWRGFIIITLGFRFSVHTVQGTTMPRRGKYPAFRALDPFFEIVLKGLAGLVDGDHFFDIMADDLVFESRYDLPDWPRMIRGPAALMNALSGYGENIKLLSSDGLIVHRCEDPRVVIIEYEVHGKVVATGIPYDNLCMAVNRPVAPPA